ncbi:MAG: hypothetical protein EOP61_17990 [Sphingomonadales bacterium]|nr:MAG: hypothetical protein EOP61_17990 [Sphingomonadales bacterium]
MRLSMIAAVAATAALCSACSPAVGSVEWCKDLSTKMQNNPNGLEDLAKMTPEEQQGLMKCGEHALSGALGQ